MKVLFVTNMLQTGGAEVLIRDLLLTISSLGHSVAVYVFHRYEGKIEEELGVAGVPVIYGLGEANFLKHVYHLGRYLSKMDYDIVHAHLYPAQLRTVLAAKLFAYNIPLVTTEHSSYYSRREQLKNRIYDRVMYLLYNHIICISEAVQETLVASYVIPSSRISTVHNGIMLEKFSVSFVSNLNKKQACTSLLAVGRLDTSKNYPLLLSAVRRVGDVVLTIAGDGHLKGSLLALAESYGVSDRVHFLGDCANVAELMRKSDFFVQASSWEGFGIAAVEAMASGLPVIISRVPGLVDIVGNAGLQFEPDDEEQLVGCITRMMNCPTLRETLRCRGHERVKLFTIENTARGYMNIYRRITE